MQYCKKCVMPDTRPNTIFVDGVCQACINHEKRKSIDWEQRWNKLVHQVLKNYNRITEPDCAVAVSGGKDSHFLVHLIKEELGMHPILIRVKDAFSNTEAGTENIKNIAKEFNCNMIEFGMSPALYKYLVKFSFEKYANFPFIDGEVYSIPIFLARKLGINLIIYGENPYFEYGTTEEDGYDATEHIKKNFKVMSNLAIESNRKNELSWLKDSRKPVLPLFMSYFVPWSSYDNYQVAKRFGFRDLSHEWVRQGNLPQDSFDQIDIVGWMVSSWLKYIKFGFGRATDIACRLIRDGRMTREKAIDLVNYHDPILDQKVLDDFLILTGYSTREFYEIVEKWYNRDIFEKINGVWKKKPEMVLR